MPLKSNPLWVPFGYLSSQYMDESHVESEHVSIVTNSAMDSKSRYDLVISIRASERSGHETVAPLMFAVIPGDPLEVHVGDDSTATFIIENDPTPTDKVSSLRSIKVLSGESSPSLWVEPDLLEIELIVHRISLEDDVIEVRSDPKFKVHLLSIQMPASNLLPQKGLVGGRNDFEGHIPSPSRGYVCQSLCFTLYQV